MTGTLGAPAGKATVPVTEDDRAANHKRYEGEELSTLLKAKVSDEIATVGRNEADAPSESSSAGSETVPVAGFHVGTA
ncbi:unannotated protein [freshwater metagenome]|uniref:Unannotated protein n=1 Tax=freshwater metagenome TaxID=449393 RepID=A0A6J5YAW8_9ZZZZ